MNSYIGIDLGTTNSAICSFDGEELRIYKSPEQNDVTPSALFIDRRGNKFIGKRAYDNAARSPDNAATLFKRLIGTNTPIKLSAVDLTLTPEECSADILRTLFGYLPEELRDDPHTGTVITVPAAFNQMQKEATLAAAAQAGIGKVALMQEPVAAVMSIMRQRKDDGIFLIYDLGGGTLDVAIAESIAGRVSLLAHGGIAMCGGRDFDRLLLADVVRPWLLEHFDLPADFITNPQFKMLTRMAAWATEKAKIELSPREDAVIALAEHELGVRDMSGSEIYLDIEITRSDVNKLITPKIDESLQTVRETMQKVALTTRDIQRVVFVGGPTNYKPLRDRIAFELGIAPSIDINPMTAVAEGAALFAESIDWHSQNRDRRSTRETLRIGDRLDVSFNYLARTPDSRAKIAIKVSDPTIRDAEFQVDSLDTGTSSGRMALSDNMTIEVALSKPGDNVFKVTVFDPSGRPISIDEDHIHIIRTAATIDAIPASSSVGVEVLDRLTGQSTLEYLVREGDPLPRKSRKVFKAGEPLEAGGSGAINFKLWEGEIEYPVSDNRFIGVLSITGTDFEEGVIAESAELMCDYEVLDSGNVILEITVPSIGGTFHSGRNYYSHQQGQIDYSTAARQVLDDAITLRQRLERIASRLSSKRLDQAFQKLGLAEQVTPTESDPEICKQAMDNVLDAKKLLAQVHKEHLREIRDLDLQQVTDVFERLIRPHAKATELTAFDNLVHTAQREIENRTSNFEGYMEQLRARNFELLWRQDWFISERFTWLKDAPHLFLDKSRHEQLVHAGTIALEKRDPDRLRDIVAELDQMRISHGSEDQMIAAVNIVQS